MHGVLRLAACTRSSEPADLLVTYAGAPTSTQTPQTGKPAGTTVSIAGVPVPVPAVGLAPQSRRRRLAGADTIHGRDLAEVLLAVMQNPWHRHSPARIQVPRQRRSLAQMQGLRQRRSLAHMQGPQRRRSLAQEAAAGSPDAAPAAGGPATAPGAQASAPAAPAQLSDAAKAALLNKTAIQVRRAAQEASAV